MLPKTSDSVLPRRVSSMPGVSTSTTGRPLIVASTSLGSSVHESTPSPTFCCSFAMRLMNWLESGKVSLSGGSPTQLGRTEDFPAPDCPKMLRAD